jgi:hypothetical protein
MKTIVLSIFLCLTILHSVAQQPASPVILYAEMQPEDSLTTTPNGKLYAKYGDTKVFITNISEAPSNLWDNYKKMKPQELDKMQTWFAGGTLYTLKYIKGTLMAYKVYIPDEGSPNNLVDEKMLKVIRLSFLTKNVPALDTELKNYLKTRPKK